ncbi:MAG: SDR family NAD(P)-dependent oxidoreductase [Acidimicrobiia bacterium]
MTVTAGGNRLAGKVALVTGASRGIGRAIALALAGAGADVALAARNVNDLKAVADEVAELGSRSVVVPLDVTDTVSVEGAVVAAVENLGRLDVLVNNAGVISSAPVLETDDQEWDRVMGTNLRGVFLCSRAAGRVLTAQRSGKVINIGSNFGIVAAPDYAVYCASKAAIHQFTRVLALEWAPFNVQVNAIAPGYVATDFNADVREDRELTERIVRRIPARRMGDPAEIGPLAVLLASPESDFMTGSTLVIDGGHSAR